MSEETFPTIKDSMLLTQTQSRNSKGLIRISETINNLQSAATIQFKTGLDFFQNRYVQSPTNQSS